MEIGGASGKEPTCQCRRHKRTQVLSLGQEDPQEEGMATYSNILAWGIPWKDEYMSEFIANRIKIDCISEGCQRIKTGSIGY